MNLIETVLSAIGLKYEPEVVLPGSTKVLQLGDPYYERGDCFPKWNCALMCDNSTQIVVYYGPNIHRDLQLFDICDPQQFDAMLELIQLHTRQTNS